MTTIPASFPAFRVHDDDAGYRSGLEELSLDGLSAGDLVIRSAFSSVNYKDALAGTGQGRILRSFPLVAGIDVAGHVAASRDRRFCEGDAVVVTGRGLGESRDGGYSHYVRVEADMAVPLPPGLDLREAMIIGTAGFTAALALLRMVENHQVPDSGPLAVTGASGGVGSLAVDIFTAAGFEVHAVSGKADQAGYLRELGASQVLDRAVLQGSRPLESVRFGGGLDNVGGSMLAGLLARTRPYGNVGCAGLAASADLDATVMPFILRGVSLLGVASTETPRHHRDEVWRRLGGDWKPRHLERICTREVRMEELPDVFRTMLSGDSLGRTVVAIG